MATSTKQSSIVSRELTCSPAGGDYTDPAAACRALADIVTKLHQAQSDPSPNTNVLCLCAVSPLPQAFGWYDRKRRTIHLNRCSLCNLGGIQADLALLLPGRS